MKTEVPKQRDKILQRICREADVDNWKDTSTKKPDRQYGEKNLPGERRNFDYIQHSQEGAGTAGLTTSGMPESEKSRELKDKIYYQFPEKTKDRVNIEFFSYVRGTGLLTLILLPNRSSMRVIKQASPQRPTLGAADSG